MTALRRVALLVEVAGLLVLVGVLAVELGVRGVLIGVACAGLGWLLHVDGPLR